MLDAAIGSLRSDGLAVGLEQVSFEDAIRAADVSRTAAYRCWPNKNAFLADLAVELAEIAVPVVATRSGQATELIRSVVARNADRLTSPSDRAEILEEVVRVTATDDFNADRAETVRWRTYLALVMSVESLPAGDLRTKVAAAVARADDLLLDRLAGNYRELVEFFGFTARIDYRSLAAIGLAMMRGLVIGEMVRPGTATDEHDEGIPAIAFAALVRSSVELNEAGPWDEATAAAKVARLRDVDLFPVTKAAVAEVPEDKVGPAEGWKAKA